jgi:catechol 2,3-dioxygenase-like lactoylglutathione lyase family enzyme
MHPKSEGILESSLYVSDIGQSVQFYQKIFGFRVISDFGGRVRDGSGGAAGVAVVPEGRVAYRAIAA